MRIFVYKRAHSGDPDINGCFGVRDCMGKHRNCDFDAVIGVGGIGREAQANGLDGKLNWIGIGPHKRNVSGKKGPLVTFDRFRNFGVSGQDFRKLAPTLAERMYTKSIRFLIVRLPGKEYNEAMRILGEFRGHST